MTLDRLVLADCLGTVTFHLAPLVERMSVPMKRFGRLFMDETKAPVLDPGRGRTKTGYLSPVLRDDDGRGGSGRSRSITMRRDAPATIPSAFSKGSAAFSR